MTLIEHGYSVTVLGWDRECKYPESEITEDRIKILRIPVKTEEMRGPKQILPIIQFFFKAAKKLLVMKIDIIHCHNLDVLPLGYIIAKIKKCKVIFDAHEPDYYALWPKKWFPLLKAVWWIECFLSRHVNYLIVTNEYQVKKYQSLGIKKISLIGNYPVRSFIIKKIPKDKMKREEIIFGRIGTIYPNVGIEETVEAIKILKTEYPFIKLYLAGRIVNAYRDDLMQAIEPIKDNVHLTGPYNAKMIPELYSKIDVSLMPYKINDWFRNITPTKFFDSIANGVPVIMTDIGGLGKVIKQHNCGIVLDKAEPSAIADAMKEIINNSQHRRQMMENGLKLANDEFNWDAMSKKLVKVYESLYDGPSPEQTPGYSRHLSKI